METYLRKDSASLNQIKERYLDRPKTTQ